MQAPPPSVRIRPLRESDLEFADELRRLAGWNQTIHDWRRFLAHDPEGCFLAEVDGRPVGTVTTTLYDPTLAWIGMMLVHPDHRRQKIGSALFEHCLNFLEARGVKSVKLDATPQGQLVYERYGFKIEQSITRWEGVIPAGKNVSAKGTETPTDPWEQIVALDAAAFGTRRHRMLRLLIDQGCPLELAAANGRVCGFGMTRAGSRASYLGPVVWSGPGDPSPLLEKLLSHLQGAVYCDVFDENAFMKEKLAALGFKPQRPLLRMYLGNPLQASAPETQLAIAGPATG